MDVVLSNVRTEKAIYQLSMNLTPFSYFCSWVTLMNFVWVGTQWQDGCRGRGVVLKEPVVVVTHLLLVYVSILWTHTYAHKHIHTQTQPGHTHSNTPLNCQKSIWTLLVTRHATNNTHTRLQRSCNSIDDVNHIFLDILFRLKSTRKLSWEMLKYYVSVNCKKTILVNMPVDIWVLI